MTSPPRLTKVPPQAQAKAKATAQDFEAMFLNSMFSQMTTGLNGEGPFGNTPGTGVWRSMLTEQYSKSFAKAGGVGISNDVYRTLILQQANRVGRPKENRHEPASSAAAGDDARPMASTPAEARKLAENLMDVMSALLGVIERETELVRAGKIREAMASEGKKARAVPALCQRGHASEGQPQISARQRRSF